MRDLFTSQSAVDSELWLFQPTGGSGKGGFLDLVEGVGRKWSQSAERRIGKRDAQGVKEREVRSKERKGKMEGVEEGRRRGGEKREEGDYYFVSCC